MQDNAKHNTKHGTIEQRQYRSTIVLVLFILSISLGVTFYYSLLRHRNALDAVILDTAAFVAEQPETVSTLQNKEASPELEALLDSIIRTNSRLNIITVCDLDSIRYYHPIAERRGEHFVGGGEAAALSGAAPYVTQGNGTMGSQRRAFHSVRDAQGQVIGFVMASILTESMTQLRSQIIMTYGIIMAVLLLISIVMIRRMVDYQRKVFLGYQPEEFRMRYLQRSEVLDALAEGIFAIDKEGHVILMNQQAKVLLGLEDVTYEGRLLKDVFPETRLPEVMETGVPEWNVSMFIHGNHIISNRIPILERDEVVGAISIFRDRTELVLIADELTGTRYMLDALRAFNHEFMNKLHVILGYLQIEDTQAAIDYISNTTLVSSQAVGQVARQIHVSRLAALIIGKMMRASELGIRLILKPESSCEKEQLIQPLDCYVTVIGNLLENAIEELDAHDYEVKEIEFGFYCTDEYNLIECEDTGGGIAPEIREHLFEKGASTKGEGRGTGMFLIKGIVDRYQGVLNIDTEPGEGTCFTISFTREEG